MGKETPRRGQAAGRGLANSGRVDSTRTPALNQPLPAPDPALDLVGLRARLVAARQRLVERLVDDFPADRRFPDSGWTRMLADIHQVIAAVDAMMDEDGP